MSFLSEEPILLLEQQALLVVLSRVDHFGFISKGLNNGFRVRNELGIPVTCLRVVFGIGLTAYHWLIGLLATKIGNDLSVPLILVGLLFKECPCYFLVVTFLVTSLFTIFKNWVEWVDWANWVSTFIQKLQIITKVLVVGWISAIIQRILIPISILNHI